MKDSSNALVIGNGLFAPFRSVATATLVCGWDLSLCGALQQPVMDAVEGKFQAVRDAQLVIDLAQVVFDNLLGGPNLVSDLFVAHSLRDAGDDEQLFV